ncbi:MAG: MFS transporter [Nostocales cyanobacterium 94392]|nr:MFS transporter [Nostocales cyanobacterium 94392]
MQLKNQHLGAYNNILLRVLRWVNLRPEEGSRTLLMFAFYATTSVGLRWVEDSSIALFLDKYGASSLPLIYIASAVVGIALVFLYSWLQKIFPLRWVIVAALPCMVIPLILLPIGLQITLSTNLQLSSLALFSVFLLRLWVDALYVINQLNTSIAANQLFNIQEIKRTYPLVSSGILVADVIGGFSLPTLVRFLKLDKVILIGALVIVLGTAILLHLSKKYPQAFSDVPQRQIKQPQVYQARRLSAPLKNYALRLFAFGLLIQTIGLLVDFQYLSQLESTFQGKEITSFLGVFGGILGLFELTTQLFVSSRIIERLGVFFTTAILPVGVGTLLAGMAMISSLSITSALFGLKIPAFSLLWGLTLIKFLDELLRYTFVANTSTLLFQPIPEKVRSRVQILSGGFAEAAAAGFTGFIILITQLLTKNFIPVNWQNLVLIIETAIIAIICVAVIWVLRSQYVDLLVLSAERGQLSVTNVDLPFFKRAVIKALREKGSEADKHSCIELLSQIDPQGAGEVLAPELLTLTPTLQSRSLEVMLESDINPAFLPQVRELLENPQTILNPNIFALALRYVSLAEASPNLNQLEEYLNPEQHSVIRGTAAALLLTYGTTKQRVAATKTLGWMLTNKEEEIRVNGVKSLAEASYLQALRIHIPSLLEDKSLKVRSIVLEMIAANNLEEYYSALIAGLQHKSTRLVAMNGLVKLGNEVLPMLSHLATNNYEPEIARVYALRTIGQIETLKAVDTLWHHLEISKGTIKCHILRTLIKRHQQQGILILVDRSYETRIQSLIEQEFKLLGEIYAASVDFKNQGEIYAAYIEFKTGETLQNFHSKKKVVALCRLVQKALAELEIDIKERLFLLLKLLYPLEKINAAVFNINSESQVNLALGLEILEHTINLPCKTILLNIFDRRPPYEKLQKLVEAGLSKYEQMAVNERTRTLLELENSLSDWCWACCIHFAQVARIKLKTTQIQASLRHPCGFVREAAVTYLSAASPRLFIKLLPQLKNDSHPLVIAQVKEFIEKYKVKR